MIFMR